MPLIEITKPGLLAIACSVALLWACLLGEHVLLRRAYADRAAVMRTIGVRPNRPHNVPVSRPELPFHGHRRPVAA